MYQCSSSATGAAALAVLAPPPAGGTSGAFSSPPSGWALSELPLAATCSRTEEARPRSGCGTSVTDSRT